MSEKKRGDASMSKIECGEDKPEYGPYS
ncbi:uncharacterized protein G2W53_012846 [Senna tora]|uniref:Uncharacterized protein n=1 Tax=Senna tora TaxID=362788 RepID=A0A834TXR0_9FABA|nr:uncharacterized protein G2W53_012846 [Senna tora]